MPLVFGLPILLGGAKGCKSTVHARPKKSSETDSVNRNCFFVDAENQSAGRGPGKNYCTPWVRGYGGRGMGGGLFFGVQIYGSQDRPIVLWRSASLFVDQRGCHSSVGALDRTSVFVSVCFLF